MPQVLDPKEVERRLVEIMNINGPVPDELMFYKEEREITCSECGNIYKKVVLCIVFPNLVGIHHDNNCHGFLIEDEPHIPGTTRKPIRCLRCGK